jgi:hypothetical protein
MLRGGPTAKEYGRPPLHVAAIHGKIRGGEQSGNFAAHQTQRTRRRDFRRFGQRQRGP